MSDQHWLSLDDVPSFLGIAFQWPELAAEPQMLALEIAPQLLILLSDSETAGGMEWFQFRSTLLKQGYEIGSAATGDRSLLKELIYGGTGSSTRSKENAAIDELIQGSEPVRNFKRIIGELIDIGTSDVHLEVRNDLAAVKVRLHGVMRHYKSYPRDMMLDALGAAFTVLAEELSRSDAAFNQRLAQAAMIPLVHKGKAYALRYQSHPTVGGLDAVLRILHLTQSSTPRSLERLGYLPDQCEKLKLSIASAWGGVFIAGITGSGKTTTLNTMLDMLVRTGGRKIVSIEDPVEYVVKGVSHLSIQRSQSDTEANNPFMGAMRAFLRLDPDVGMFGEIRDRISGEIAQSAIETGHKIFTTVHATSALGIIGRLSSRMIGIDRSTVCNPEFISALVYQVLMPRNCMNCRTPATEVMDAAELQDFERIFELDPRKFFCASDAGCAKCRIPGMEQHAEKGSRLGVAGMTVAAEVVPPDMHLLQLLAEGHDFEARRYRMASRLAAFDVPDMTGKDAWGHALYGVSQGIIDPYFFVNTFGYPMGFEGILKAART
ncbi:GspE/PulE family protein [Leptothrix sp. BB-4]